MDMQDVVGLFLLMGVLALLPSSSVALVVARASIGGLRQGAGVALGIVLGDLVFVVLAVSGMAVLANTVGGIFLLLKYLAALYLVWLGISLIRGKEVITTPETGAGKGLLASLLSGLAITLGDIKAIFFYASLFPLFVDLTAINAADLVTIVLVTVVAVGCVKLGYAFAASKLLSLTKGFKSQRAVELTAGSLMVGAGGYLMVKV
jgi:threonine/homoserine/homoserine lactone efflux protein